jgi:hypothetical protein
VQVVLEAIEEHWKTNPLNEKQQIHLGRLVDGTREPLHELEVLLNNHKSLGGFKRQKRDHFVWGKKSLLNSINPIRSNLEKRMMQLAIFNQVVSR